MLFKNLLVYRLSPSFTLDEETLEAALANLPAKPCGSQTASTYGLTAPTRFADEPPLVHACQGFLLVAGQLEERLLPGSVVRDAVAEKVSEIALWHSLSRHDRSPPGRLEAKCLSELFRGLGQSDV